MYQSLFKDAHGVLITCIICGISLPLTYFYSDGFQCEVDWSVGLRPRRPCWRICWSSCAPAAGIDWTSDRREAIFSPRLCHSHTLWNCSVCLYRCLTFLAVSAALAVSQLSSADCATTPSQQVFVVERSVAGPIVWILVTRVSSGPNAQHRQSHIGINYSPVRGAKGHVAH